MMEILKLNLDGTYSRDYLTELADWCTSPEEEKLLVGDWNGDGLTDLLCHHQTGHMKALINQAGQNLRNVKLAIFENDRRKNPKLDLLKISTAV